jgi:uncharacterized membrane protein YtjA (UPF0391 family)
VSYKPSIAFPTELRVRTVDSAPTSGVDPGRGGLIAGAFGFFGIAAGAAGIVKVPFVLFLIGAVIAVLLGRSRA